MKKGKLKESELTKEFLHECFTYKDGYLYWKFRPMEHFTSISNCKRFNTPNAGNKAGYFNKRTDSQRVDFGYWRVGISHLGRLGHFKLHRLVWLYHKGYLPEFIDHDNNDSTDNRIENLRESNTSENGCNSYIAANNTSGYKGVTVSKDIKRRKIPYKVAIEWDGYIFSLGSYSCIHYAAMVYNVAARCLHKQFALYNDTPVKEDSLVIKGKFLSEIYPKLLDGTFDWASKSRRNRRSVDSHHVEFKGVN